MKNNKLIVYVLLITMLTTFSTRSVGYFFYSYAQSTNDSIIYPKSNFLISENTQINQTSASTLSSSVEQQPNTLPFPVTIRDFNADYIFFEVMSHSYAQDPSTGKWLEEGFPKSQSYGVVQNKLSADKKPIINDATVEDIVEDLYSNYSIDGTNYIRKLDYVNIPNDFKNPNPTLLKATNVFKEKGTLEDAKTFYENNKHKSFTEISPTTSKDDTRINTAYRYVYYYVNRLFLDTDGLNTQDSTAIKSLDLTLDNGIYSYSSSSFFYMDNKGFNQKIFYRWINGKPSLTPQSIVRPHNYNFTLESHTKFWFDSEAMADDETLEFKFSGDDDVWIYIDNKLVIDIGGKHESLAQSILINKEGYITNTLLGNTPGAKLESKTYPGTYSLENTVVDSNGLGYVAKLDETNWYDFDFFYIERHSSQSNFNISTNMLFNPKISCTKEAYIETVDGNDKYLDTTKDYVSPGDTIYYKIGASNTGNLDLIDVVLLDENLKIKIDKNGVFNSETNEEIVFEDLEIVKLDRYNNEIDPQNPKDFSKFSELKIYESIYVKSKEFLKYDVADKDLINGNVLNKAVVCAYYEGNGVSSKDEVTVNVMVNNNIDLKTSILKVVNKITRDDKVIYEFNNENYTEVPLLQPKDKVEFRLILNNESVSLNTGKYIPLGSLSIEDILSPDEYSKFDFKFYLTTKEEFDVSEFTLSKKLDGDIPELELITSEWIVPEILKDYSYDVTNTAKLFKTIDGEKSEISLSSVDLKIKRPSLRILKNVLDNNGVVVEDNTGFTITVCGDDESVYNVKLNSKEECVLDNLKYNVTYKISELPIMNYALLEIDTESITLTSENNNSLITITNKKVNDKWFSDKSVTENKITIPVKEVYYEK